MNVVRLDKTAFEIRPTGCRKWAASGTEAAFWRTRSLHDHVNDRKLWLTRTPEERFAAIEFRWPLNYGEDKHPPRLQRVLEGIERSRG